MLEFVATGKGPHLSGALGQLHAPPLDFRRRLCFDAHFLHSGEKFGGAHERTVGTDGHMWAQMEDGPKKNLALCKKAMSPFWDESVPTNWLTDVFLEARASLTQGGDSPTGLPTSSQIGFPTGFPTGPPTGRPSITFGSLFTGIGAGHEALRAVPHQWIFAVECDRYCCDVLRELPAGPSLLLQQKVETVDMDMLPPVDLLLAAPPCQGFSACRTAAP